jgi:hypothetical protein
MRALVSLFISDAGLGEDLLDDRGFGSFGIPMSSHCAGIASESAT